MVEVIVRPSDAGKKVHRYIRQLLPGVPLSGIHKMLRTGRVKVNGKKAKGESVVAEGDRISLYMAQEDYDDVTKPAKKFGGVSREVSILHEDDTMIVVNKEAGLLTHGDETEQKDTLVNRVQAVLYDAGRLALGVFLPAPVNRLDRNTSGLVVFGKTAAATRDLATQFATHDVRKWYVAIVHGSIDEQGVISAALERAGSRTKVVEEGKDAETRYRRVAAVGKTSVIQVELVTGRTHQIRSHLQHIGHPLCGDVKYGGGQAYSGAAADQHQWLHAGWLWLPNGQKFAAPLPGAFCQELRDFGYSSRDLYAIEMLSPSWLSS